MWNGYKKAVKDWCGGSIISWLLSGIQLVIIISIVYLSIRYPVFVPIYLKVLISCLVVVLVPFIVLAFEVISHRNAVLKLPDVNESDIFSDTHTRFYRINLSCEKAFLKCLKILEITFSSDLTVSDEEKKTIQTINYGLWHKPISKIEVEFHGISDDQTELKITCQDLKLFLGGVDHGRKLRNIQTILKLVNIDDLNSPEAAEMFSKLRKFERQKPFFEIIVITVFAILLILVVYSIY
jgi:hypothetical protein